MAAGCSVLGQAFFLRDTNLKPGRSRRRLCGTTRDILVEKNAPHAIRRAPHAGLFKKRNGLLAGHVGKVVEELSVSSHPT